MKATSFADYRDIPAVNWSALKYLRESPAHYRHALTAPRRDTPSMAFGRAVHTAVLEPDAFGRLYSVYDGRRDARTRAYRAHLEDHPGTEILTSAEVAKIEAIVAAIRAHPCAGAYLVHGQPEVTITWTDEETDIRCKARIDWLTIDDRSARIVDLKTTRTTHPKRFGSQAAILGYHCQMAHYAAGVRAVYGLPVEVVIIAVESEPPHDVAAFLLGENQLYPGETEVRDLLALLRRCLDEDRWPGRSDELQLLELPAWVYPGDEDDADALGIAISTED